MESRPSMKSNYFLISLFFLITACGPKVEVKTIKLVKGTVESSVTTTNSGTVEAKQQAELAFGGPGRIARINVQLGDKVNAGTIIAELENSDLRAIYDETNKEYSRAQEFFKSGLVARANLDSAYRAREVAKTNLNKSLIVAPFDGMITALNIKVGEFYQSSAGIASTTKKIDVQIIDLKSRLIKGEIDEVDLQRIQIGQEARVRIPALKNQMIRARLTKVVPFVSTVKDQDRTSQIELEVLENNVLIPVGASADVEIIVEKKENANILPTTALTGVGSDRSVFVVNGSKLEKRSIKVGTGNYERVEILSGINAEDQVAQPLEGVELTEGMKVKAQEMKWP
jgi:HlyD family secretion protein